MEWQTQGDEKAGPTKSNSNSSSSNSISWTEPDASDYLPKRGMKRSRNPKLTCDLRDSIDVTDGLDELTKKLEKHCKLDADVQKLVDLGKEMGKKAAIVEACMQYLPSEIIRACAKYSKLWWKTAQKVIRGRNADHPFLLLWMSQTKNEGRRRRVFDMDQFVQILEDKDFIPCQAVLFLATAEMQTIPETVPILKNRITGIFGFAGRIIIGTTPDYMASFEIDESLIHGPPQPTPYYSNYGTEACQALCIPKSEHLVLNEFFVPAYSDEDDKAVNEILGAFRTACTPPGYSLKGVIMMMCYGTDALIKEIVEQEINRIMPNAPLVGGSVDNVLSSGGSDLPLMACGWAICGNKEVRVSSVALEVKNIPQQEIVYANIRDHFENARDGFIIIFYSLECRETAAIVETLKGFVGPGIPIVGILAELSDLIFQGHVFCGEEANFLSYFNKDSGALDMLKMICILVAY